MSTIEMENKLVEGYMGLLQTLSAAAKLDLISKLTASVKKDMKGGNSSFKKAFGAFVSDQNGEEMIEDIRKSRISSRQIESF